MHKLHITYDSLVKFLLIWCVLQDFILSIFYKITNCFYVTNILFYSKDILLIVLFLWANYRVRFKYQIIIGFYFLIVCIASIIGLCNSENNIMSVFQNIRNVILLPSFFIIGMSLNDMDSFKSFIEKKYLIIILISVIFGLLDYYIDSFVGTIDFWRNTIGFTKFYSDIKHQTGKMLFGLPGNFYGSYGVGFFAVKRLVGFWGNPLTCAYTLLFPLVFLFLKIFDEETIKIDNKVLKVRKSGVKNIGVLIVFLFGLYYSHTRAIIFLVLIFYAVYFLYHNKKYILHLSILLSFVIILYLLTNFQTFRNYIYDGSTLGHIEEVFGFIKSAELSLFGHGINYAGTSSSYNIGTESSYLTLVGNVGVVGLALFLYLYFFPLYKILINYGSSKITYFEKAILISGLIYGLTGLLSEQLFAYTTIAPFYILLGSSYRLIKKYNKY